MVEPKQSTSVSNSEDQQFLLQSAKKSLYEVQEQNVNLKSLHNEEINQLKVLFLFHLFILFYFHFFFLSVFNTIIKLIKI